MRVVVTGGAGFIGSAVVRWLLSKTNCIVLNLDKLTYAGNLASLDPIAGHSRYQFVRGDIADRNLVAVTLREFNPTAIINLAAETHVDRSIDSAKAFIETNIVGTFNLLECVREYWNLLPSPERQDFRFLHVSTDEVFGALPTVGLFTEHSNYQPNSPYAASKASSDHLVRAWFHTYGLPTLICNCSNNYGPYQYPEKLIPLLILKAMSGKSLPIYGNGENVRDWLYVDDHAAALHCVLERGNPGETYNIGARCERDNLALAKELCTHLDQMHPHPSAVKYESTIEFVVDRPGHDLRYAIDPSKIESELGWKPQVSLTEGMQRTVRWYLDNQAWWKAIDMSYSGERLGVSTFKAEMRKGIQ